MLGAFKRLFANPGTASEWEDVAVWAQRRGHRFRPARDAQGFVIEGRLEGLPWRMEWGRSQRPYIEGNELRLRMELELPPEMQMLVLARPLMELLEKQTYERFTQGMQTQIDTSTPEEMRWLVMFPKIELGGSLRALRSNFGLVSSAPAHGMAWISGPLAHQLEDAATKCLRDGVPFVLMTLRGRAYLRMQLEEPVLASLADALAIFETAAAEALRAAEAHAKSSATWPSSTVTAWQTLIPDDLVPPKPK